MLPSSVLHSTRRQWQHDTCAKLAPPEHGGLQARLCLEAEPWFVVRTRPGNLPANHDSLNKILLRPSLWHNGQYVEAANCPRKLRLPTENAYLCLPSGHRNGFNPDSARQSRCLLSGNTTSFRRALARFVTSQQLGCGQPFEKEPLQTHSFELSPRQKSCCHHR